MSVYIVPSVCTESLFCEYVRLCEDSTRKYEKYESWLCEDRQSPNYVMFGALTIWEWYWYDKVLFVPCEDNVLFVDVLHVLRSAGAQIGDAVRALQALINLGYNI